MVEIRETIVAILGLLAIACMLLLAVDFLFVAEFLPMEKPWIEMVRDAVS